MGSAWFSVVQRFSVSNYAFDWAGVGLRLWACIALIVKLLWGSCNFETLTRLSKSGSGSWSLGLGFEAFWVQSHPKPQNP